MARRLDDNRRGVMITPDSARRIAKAVQAYEQGRTNIRAKPLRTAEEWPDEYIKLAKTSAAIDVLSTGEVTVYKSPDSTYCDRGCVLDDYESTGETICAHNLIEKIGADEWIYLLKPAGGQAWHIIGKPEQQQEEYEEDSCGLVQKDALTLSFTACHGSGASAVAEVDGACAGAIANVQMVEPGSGYAIVARLEPEATLTGGGGGGATYEITYTQNADECEIPSWSVSAVSVSGGTGYTDGSRLRVKPAGGTVIEVCPVLLIECGSDGVPTGVTVQDGGTLYKEDKEAAPYVADVTVTVSQTGTTTGSGASFTVVIDDDPLSSTFGQITGVTVDEGGTNYIGKKNVYESKWQGLDFSTIPNFDGSAVQILGHSAGGCLEWFSITSCQDTGSGSGDPEEEGVCCVEGDGAETTRAECEAVEGTFHAGAKLTDIPGPCCP